jgi:hypothetical protein
MKKVKYKNLKIFQVATIISVVVLFGFLGIAKAEYYESGTIVSKNLLYGLYTNSVDSFGYDVTIPANTTARIQFGQFGELGDWYSSSGVQDEWDTLEDGDHLAENDAIDLSALGWTDPCFQYKISITTTDTSSSTPTLSEVKVYYEEGSAPETSYETSGTVVSQNVLDEVEVNNVVTGFYYNLSSLPIGTSVRVQFSQDKTTWYNSAGEESGWDSLALGDFLIDLKGLGWSGINFYYKIELTGDGTNTPVLDEVRTYYQEGSISDYPDPLRYGNDITFEVEWSATLSSGVKLYVCKAEDGTSAGCGAGGSWCTNSDDFETGKTITCSYTTEEVDEGSNNYYIYVCDSSDNCSSAMSGTFTVGSVSTPSVKFEGGIKFKGGTKFK